MNRCDICREVFRSRQQLAAHRRGGCAGPIPERPAPKPRHRLFELRRWETGWAAICACGQGATGPTPEAAKQAFSPHVKGPSPCVPGSRSAPQP